MSASRAFELEKLRTGIAGFDQISNGGLPLNRSTLVSGTAGSGKTVLALQFLVMGVQTCAEHGVCVTFEEAPEDLMRNVASFGWDFESLNRNGQIAIVDATPEQGEEMVEAGAYDLSALMVRIENAIRKVNAKRVVLDSVGALFPQFSDANVVRRELHRIASALRLLGVTTIITMERLDEDGGLARFGVEEFVADNVLVLRNRLEQEKRRRTIEILKFRGATHQKGEYPFTVDHAEGVTIIPLSAIELKQRSSDLRVSSGVPELDQMCGGGFYRDSIILVSGATGTGKTLMVTHYLRAAIERGERALLIAAEESREQLTRNASNWNVDFDSAEKEGLLRIIARYPETMGLEDHLLYIQREINEFQPSRIAVDSLSAFERAGTPKSYREFVIALTSHIKKVGITGLFTNTTSMLMGGASITETHISTITDMIVLLRYVELYGVMRRGLAILKMRGTQHDKDIREYVIDGHGMHLVSTFRDVHGILTGAPTYMFARERDHLAEMFGGSQSELQAGTSDMDASTYRVLVIGGEAAAPLLAAGGSEGGDKAEFDLSRASTIAEARRRLETASYDTILMNLASSQVAAAFPEELYALASASPVVLFNQSADGHDGAGQARLRLPLGAPATRALSAESHRHFGQLLEAVPDALIVTNQDNEVAFVNRAAHELFGKARDDFIGERVSFAVSEGAVSEIEVYRGKDVRRCELRVSRCEWEGAPAQLLLIQDVTEQKRLNEELRQSQKMEAVGVLAGGIAHDFNNLLVVMMIYAEMLREECLGDDPRLPDVMELIKAIERGRDLTRQLLAFSRKQPATPTLLDLGATLADLQKMFRRLLPSNIEISIDVEEQSWPVIADRVQVEQLIMNLALNARDAMPSGGQLTIRLANRTIQCGDEGMEPGDYVMMTVSDTGTGIPPDDLDRIFDPFFTTKVRGGGTGLGLATCYGIVKQAGGSIAVRSAIGEGTSFIVLLPRANETIQTEAAPAPPVQQARGGERILLVEDNSLAQRATAAMLTRAGYSVQSTSNGEEALRFLREHADAVDLVLSDVVMPRLSGPELARQLAVSHPDLPVLFMTGYSNDPIIADAGEHRIGGRRTIMKPFKREDLLAFISDAIERKRCAEAS